MFFPGRNIDAHKHKHEGIQAQRRAKTHTCERHSFFFFQAWGDRRCVQTWGDRLTIKSNGAPQKPLSRTLRQALDVVDCRVLIFFGTSAFAHSMHKPVKFP